MRLLYCEDEQEGGGGGGGDDEEEEEEECSCPAEVPCEMEAEYKKEGVKDIIERDKFSTGPRSEYFSWSELNGGWAGGNEAKHMPYGYIDPGLRSPLDRLRVVAVADPVLNIEVLVLSSGFRCPGGNSSLRGSAEQSKHMSGRAVDISTGYHWRHLPDSVWNVYYDLLAEKAESVGFTTLPFEEYDDHHLHIQLK